MALQNQPFFWYPKVEIPFTQVGFAIDASGEKLAFVFQCPQAGNITAVHFRLKTVTTGQTLRVSLQNVDLATGDPDGTADQSGTVAVADTDDNAAKSVTLDVARTVTRGELLSIVVEFDSTVGNLEVLVGNTLALGSAYPDHFTVSWGKQARAPVFVLEYSGGVFHPTPGVLPGPYADVDFSSSTTPDEVALRFQLPFPARVMGIGFYGRFTGDVDFVLYEGTTALATAVVDNTPKIGTTEFYYPALFATPVDILANTVYRAALKASTTTSTRVIATDVGAAAHLGGMSGGAELYFSGRTDAGAWSDTTTRRPAIFLVLEGASDGAGGGGLIGPGGIRGGFQ